MGKQNLEKDKNSEPEMCRRCEEEPVFMDGLCVYCYEDEVYEEGEFEDKHKDSKMTVHGQNLKDPHQQKISRERTISKITRKKK